MEIGGLVQMSQQELLRLEMIQKMLCKQLTQVEGGELLGVGERQIRRLIRRYKACGAKGLISRKRGQQSHRKYSEEFRREVMALVSQHYYDFGPQLASEKLNERHQIQISRETLRQWMMSEGVWKGKPRKRSQKVHERRLRRASLGELVQIDGSPHPWFEERASRCCLIVFIDDASSKILIARFYPAETTFAYFNTAKLHWQRYGLPDAYYSDKHNIFRININNAHSGTGMSQFERAMHEMDIELINANTPQAKGRVERAYKTLQDRLVKELRLNNISDIETANQFIDTFIEDHNRRFAIAPRNPQDRHRKIDNIEDYQYVLTHQSCRRLSNALTLQYRNKIYQVKVPGEGYTLRRAKVTVCEEGSGKITLFHRNRPLDYILFDQQMQHSQIKSDKEVEVPGTQHKRNPRYVPPKNHPYRKHFIINPQKAAQTSQLR